MAKLALALIVGTLLTAACAKNGTDHAARTAEPAGSVTLLAPADYKTAIAGSGAFVVNLHIPYEGEIEGTDAFIPFDRVAEHATELPADKSAPLYIYCRSGRMSAEATPDLQRLGHTNIIDLDGGMRAWEEAGLTLVHRRVSLSPS